MESGQAGDPRATLRLNNFDLLRLIAATQVCICHGLLWLNIPWPPIVNYLTDLFPGVPMFFLISGFLISGSLERKPGNLREYFKNRFLRIYPALWVCLAVSIASVMIVRPEIFHQTGWKDIAVWVAAQASIVQLWNPGFLRGYGVGVLNGSLWTIPVEIQFYVVLPVLYKSLGLHRHKRNGLLLAVAVVLAALNWHVKVLEDTAVSRQIWFKLYNGTFVPHLFMFMMGVLAKRNFNIIYPLVAGRAFLWFLVYASVSYVIYWFGILPSNPLTLTLLAIFLLASAYTRPAFTEWLLKGNDISYGTYLYNMVVINMMRELGYVKEPVYLLVAITAIFGLGALSWRYVERPALALKSRPALMTAEPIPPSHEIAARQRVA